MNHRQVPDREGTPVCDGLQNENEALMKKALVNRHENANGRPMRNHSTPRIRTYTQDPMEMPTGVPRSSNNLRTKHALYQHANEVVSLGSLIWLLH